MWLSPSYIEQEWKGLRGNCKKMQLLQALIYFGRLCVMGTEDKYCLFFFSLPPFFFRCPCPMRCVNLALLYFVCSTLLPRAKTSHPPFLSLSLSLYPFISLCSLPSESPYLIPLTFPILELFVSLMAYVIRK